MSTILVLSFLFAIGSFVGWGLEVLFRKFFSDTNPERKWINPGFLTGPYLPLYGCSLIILFLLSELEKYVPIDNPYIRKPVLFLIMAATITVVEYFTGLIFIVKLKIKLWDYSDNFGNVKGIICPRYTFYWSILSAVYYFLINPHIINALKWLSENLTFSFFIGFFYGVFSIDVVLSVKKMAEIHKFAEDNEIIILLEELRHQIREHREQKKEKKHFFILLTPHDLQEHLKKYKEKNDIIKQKISVHIKELKDKRKSDTSK